MPCNTLISDADIEAIYFDGNFVCSNDVASLCDTSEVKKSQINMYDKDSNSMLVKPIERTYFKNKELLSQEGNFGKVVKHEYFILKDAYRGKALIKKIHPREMDAYKANNFCEIQLDAAWDGLVVWKKMFFKFKDVKAENYIKIGIQRYLREVKGLSLEEISKAIKNNPFSISPSLLKDENNHENDFIRWIERLRGRQVVVRMYKEVA